jgi:hypothetical protein
MTEAEWLEGLPDLRAMIDYLYNLEPQPSRRKTRLCMVAFCRAIWHVMTDERCRHAVEVAERFADDLAAKADLKTAIEALPKKRRDFSALYKTAPIDAACSCATRKEQFLFAALTQVNALTVLALENGSHDPSTASAQVRRQTEMIHDIFANPFRPVALIAAQRTPTVVSLAEAAYEERQLPSGELDRSRLAVLADALEDAGCTDVDILGHLRNPGRHVRGCWPLDLILSKDR